MLDVFSKQLKCRTAIARNLLKASTQSTHFPHLPAVCQNFIDIYTLITKAVPTMCEMHQQIGNGLHSMWHYTAGEEGCFVECNKLTILLTFVATLVNIYYLISLSFPNLKRNSFDNFSDFCRESRRLRNDETR